jgi:lysophospholipase L1-like esterase
MMSRFSDGRIRRVRARDAVFVVFVAGLILVLLQGPSIRKSGDELKPGIERDAVLAVGRPAADIANGLPFAEASTKATAFLEPEPNLGGSGGFQQAAGAGGQLGAVTPDAFDPATIGAKPPPRHGLKRLLLTGDSMVEPLDSDVAQKLAPKGVDVISDAHVGTGISSTLLVNWGKLSAYQVKHDHPDAVVVFIGANDGFPMPGAGGREIECCSAEWAAIYANRVRQIANTYRQNGVAKVYWITLPTPREPARQTIARVVNAAIAVGVAPWADQVRVIDSVPIFTPGAVYRDSMKIGGTPTIVRKSDGIHLNEAGSSLLATYVLGAIGKDFTY